MPDEKPMIARKGLLFVISSPSGAGKSTISRRLLAEDREIAMSVSATTRAPRPGEVDGKDYHFVSVERFEAMAANGDFLEWAHVFGNRYGTPRLAVEQALEAGSDILFDIDWQGAQQLSQQMGESVVRLFILPPSLPELEARLRSRATDSDDVIRGRMERAVSEIGHWDGYDYVLLNDDIDACFAQVHTILKAERLRRQRQTGLVSFVRDLVSGG